MFQNALATDVESIIELLNGCRLGNYAAALEGYSVDEGDKYRLLAEARLDGEYYRQLNGVTKGMKDGATVSRAFSLITDMLNLQIILRAVMSEVGAEAAGYAVSGGYMISEPVVKDLTTLKLNEIPDRLDNTEYRSKVEEVISNYDSTKSLAVVEEIIDKNISSIKKSINPIMRLLFRI